VHFEPSQRLDCYQRLVFFLVILDRAERRDWWIGPRAAIIRRGPFRLLWESVGPNLHSVDAAIGIDRHHSECGINVFSGDAKLFRGLGECWLAVRYRDSH